LVHYSRSYEKKTKRRLACWVKRWLHPAGWHHPYFRGSNFNVFPLIRRITRPQIALGLSFKVRDLCKSMQNNHLLLGYTWSSIFIKISFWCLMYIFKCDMPSHGLFFMKKMYDAEVSYNVYRIPNFLIMVLRCHEWKYRIH